MPELGRYKKIPRPESIEFFKNIVSSKEFVLSVECIGPQVYKISRSNKHDITVFLTNIYIVGEADVYEITSTQNNIDCIVTISAWNSYSNDAKELAKTMNIGLFNVKEFLGAIFYERANFINYTLPKKDDERIIAARLRSR